MSKNKNSLAALAAISKQPATVVRQQAEPAPEVVATPKPTPPVAEKKIEIAGQAAVEKAIKQNKSKKTTIVTMRVSEQELEIMDRLAAMLKKDYGLQYSNTNAVRVALRLLDPANPSIPDVAEAIRSEDGRRQR